MPAPLVLFGASDRHNLGDLLFPHLLAALLPGRPLVFAGLAARDLRPFGGHRVEALHRLAAAGRLRGADLVHVGGEILSCTARQAAAMLLPPDSLDATLAHLERHPAEERRWRRALLGTDAAMPYVAARAALPGVARIVFHAVGGVALGALPPASRRAVRARLAAADAVTVRDRATQEVLRADGIEAALLPDAAVMTAALFGPAIRARADRPPVAALRAAFPRGYLALQLAAEFGDDATLDGIAPALRAVLAEAGLGLVLFRAGAAAWHDAPALIDRLAERLAAPRVDGLPPACVRRFDALDVWDLCALLAASRVHAGSSLHGHLVASAFGVPALALPKPHDPAQGDKLAAWVRTWEAPADALLHPHAQLADGLRAALRADPRRLRRQAARWADAHRRGFARLAARLAAPGPAG